MTYEVKALGPLDWDAESLTEKDAVYPDGPAPLFASGSALHFLPDPDEATAVNLALLARGEASTVVTGQQPGRMIGPLYSLFKIATTVDLARHRTAMGQPTVPVFWSGDADDDLDEAMAPLCWDPSTHRFLELPGGPGRKHPGRIDPMIGRVAVAETVTLEAAWLERIAHETGESLARDLASIWNTAIAGDYSWKQLQHCALARVFAGTGLVIISGDDPGLHQAAEPLYSEILERMSELVGAGCRGQDDGAISNRSWQHPLFRVSGDGRVPLELLGRPGSTSDLRPGVVFRSPIQDWLLRPAAVVAGPGEWAYLKQLRSVYEALGIPRAPLIPRLSGWLLPEGGVVSNLLIPSNSDEADTQAARVAAAGRRELESILTKEIGLDPVRAEELSRGRTRRWTKGLESMLRDEAGRARLHRYGQYPGWVFPQGKRQERTLAAGCALALWGEGLMASTYDAAAQHREAGATGSWLTFGLTVPDPNSSKGMS